MSNNWPSEKLERMSGHVEQAALHNRDQAVSWQRWVMAASLSINGGAAIAVLNMTQIYESSRFWAITWFVAGLLSSIGFGIAASILTARFSGYYITQGWQIANLEEDEKPKLDLATFDKLLKWEKNTFWIQFIGLVSFVIGISVAVEGFK